ncbi:hypothetical protein SERLADRAFT_364573 [Serpula lacrymans var. lacrymans S7.9]|uniref:Uncharacterized protein n=1 Tax=Serpula lacrymans var. lacrymans (strain S7.9) TaxID=578457 RepID=F8ND00_SERL9|nr:uncharacterized protein SERLADRAFT_364573 [Serpula lacrymans var. lacrymans S7.9]EGO30744.1 hypothetical protein SERLADRAFT_364573 [Serpula lacrymans var. lacrymans S7.9]
MCDFRLNSFPPTNKLHIINSLLYYIRGIKHNHTLVEVKILTNHRIHTKDVTVVPDLQVIMSNFTIGCITKPEILWIRDMGFSQNRDAMVRKMTIMVNKILSVSLLLLSFISEYCKWTSPQTGKKLTFKQFHPKKTEQTMFGPVIVEGHY